MSNDNTKSNEYSQKILEAMDIIAQSKINSISFDKTITCTITNDEKRKEGEYEVSNGISKFKAYSQDNSYRKDDVVYVTIPEGNYDNQKMIIGKKTDEDIKPYVFQMPFDTIFDMTGNMIAEKPNGMLLANDVEYNQETLEVTDVNPKATEILINTLTNINQSNYTRLGIKADFKTWVAEAIQGSYGLRLEVTTEAPNAVPDKEGKQENGETTTTTHILIFNVNDMYGNPYSYETFYNQEKVFNISEFDKITKIEVYFYQNGDFYDKQDNLISAVDAFQSRLWENLYVDNLYLCLGYDINTLTNDYVEIFTQNSSDYARSTVATDTIESVNNKNKKTIQTRWVHINDEEIPTDMIKDDSVSDKPFVVRWYRYHIGVAAADSYSGVYWEKVNEFITTLNEDDNKYHYNKSNFNYEFIPDINNQQEKLKSIILYDYKPASTTIDENNNVVKISEFCIPYYSNEIVFENQETLPPGQTAQHIANALNIIVDDGSNGNYLIYGQDNNIKDTSYGDEIRTLSAEFDTNNDGEYESDIGLNNLDNENNYLIWEFPTLNTMIEILNDEKDEEGKHTGKIKNNWPQYKISKYYSPSKTNNTIICQYTLNGIIYNSEIEFTFGPSGTMGTDQTLVIDFDGDTNAAIHGDKTAKFILRVYNNQNKDISADIDYEQIQWYWYGYENGKIIEQSINGEKVDNTLTISYSGNASFNINTLYILKASLGPLSTYFPIPVKKESKYSHIQGASQVIYLSNGEPSYNRSKYQLFTNGGTVPEGNITWYLINSDTSSKYVGNINPDGTFTPLGVFVEDAPIYGVQAKDANENILWTQPILVLQNKWGNNVLNEWDGKKLEIDEGQGLIISNAIAAGKKETTQGDYYNTFSGVIMGDWSDLNASKDQTQHTGVYGFHHGAMSYAFKEDGTAFIGKDGKGRIILDGNKGVIQSASWTNNSYPKMQIDLDDTKIEMYGSRSDYIKIDATNTNYPIELGGSLRINLSNNQIGYIGGLTANQGGIPEGEQAQGFGLRLLKGINTEVGGFKATSSNTGMYYVGGGYLSISDGALSMGSEDLNLYASNSIGVTSAKISLDATHVGLWVDNTGYLTFGKSQGSGNNFKREFIMQTDNSKIVADNDHIGWWQTGSGWMSWYTSQSLGTSINGNKPVPCLVIEGNNDKSTYLKVANIPASQQFGIYARFA